VPALPYSFRIYQGDGTTRSFSVPFPFISRQHVKAYINWDVNPDTGDDVLVDFAWVSNRYSCVKGIFENVFLLAHADILIKNNALLHLPHFSIATTSSQ
jgi:hypothetical protein